MNYQQLEELLFELTDLEKELQVSELSDEMLKKKMLSLSLSNEWFLDSAITWSDSKEASKSCSQAAYTYSLENDVLKLNVTDNIFVIGKHTRFAKMLNHTHNLFEMNYIYSGTFYQEIQGGKFKLT
ncbi:MAG: hypothetical protein K0Q87_4578, partial [Neobacillus sp.]|nr:hypothetical protein [Neobacillus sp.]